MNYLKSLKIFFAGFIHSKEIFVVCILFYILGIVFAFMNPDQAHLTFPDGLFLSNIYGQIQLPEVITFDYFLDQLFYYLRADFFNIFLNNVILALLCIFSGVAIFPVILIGLFMKMGTTTFFSNWKIRIWYWILALLGSFHLYFEFLAALLTIDGFFKFYIPFYNALKDKDVNIFKNSVLKDFLPLVLRIFLLLAIAAVLEVFLEYMGVYILTNHYISWYDFYYDAYSVLLK